MKSQVILLVALMMLVKPLWPVVDYIINYEYIVEVLCENKDRPELQCDGKCYLAKQLAKESQENEKNPFEKQSTVEIQQIVFFETISQIELCKYSEDFAQNNFDTAQKLISSLFTSNTSPPPRWV